MRNIFLSAITGLALALSAAACGNNGAAPGATFLPGDYVAGFAAGYEDNYVDCSGFHYHIAMETFGLLQLTVDEDGTITGTFTDYFITASPRSPCRVKMTAMAMSMRWKARLWAPHSRPKSSIMIWS